MIYSSCKCKKSIKKAQFRLFQKLLYIRVPSLFFKHVGAFNLKTFNCDLLKRTQFKCVCQLIQKSNVYNSSYPYEGIWYHSCSQWFQKMWMYLKRKQICTNIQITYCLYLTRHNNKLNALFICIWNEMIHHSNMPVANAQNYIKYWNINADD